MDFAVVSAALVLTSVYRLNRSVYASVYFVASAGIRIDLNSKNIDASSDVAAKAEGTQESSIMAAIAIAKIFFIGFMISLSFQSKN